MPVKLSDRIPRAKAVWNPKPMKVPSVPGSVVPRAKKTATSAQFRRASISSMMGAANAVAAARTRAMNDFACILGDE